MLHVELDTAHLKVIFNYLNQIETVTVVFMAIPLLLCHTGLFSDIMDVQACSHSSKLIHHWIKVKEQNSPQTGPRKGHV